ncbi:MAG: UbiA family prenyltransferase, partial [Clostridium sp.]
GYLVMILASVMLNETCIILSPVAVIILIVQAYSKRFTWGCHFFLGIATSAAPIGVWIACAGKVSLIAILIGIGNMLWITASDIVYSIKSYEFNVKNGNPSMTTRFGVENSIKIARGIYYIATIVLVSVGLISNKLGLLYYIMLIILIGTIFKTNIGIVFEYKRSLTLNIE